MKLYGIKNCDTVKKAKKFLDRHEVDYEFIDLKTMELDINLIKTWLTEHPEVINKRSTTYRQIKEKLMTVEGKIDETAKLVQTNPTVIKRPIIIIQDVLLIGFNEKTYQQHFS